MLHIYNMLSRDEYPLKTIDAPELFNRSQSKLSLSDLKAIFRVKKDRYERKSKDHARCKRKYNFAYYVFGMITVILSSISSVLLGSKSIVSVKDNYIIVAFCFNIITTVLSLGLNFLGVENKASVHNVSKLQYRDLALDIEALLVTESDVEEYKDYEKVVIEREKMINSMSIDTNSFLLCDSK